MQCRTESGEQRRAIHFHHLKKTIHRKTLDYRKRCILYIEKIGWVFIKMAQKKDLVISIILSWLDGEEGWTLDGWMVGGLWRQMISIIERSYRYVAGCSLRLQK